MAEIASFRSQLPKEERTFENTIPKHVPIKIKLKSEKEKAFKDLTNAQWYQDFELEVTNTSDKPIYYMELWLVLPETMSENNVQLAFPLRYGRVDLINSNTRPIATDVPIQPGETHSFAILDTWQRGWRQYKPRSNVPDPGKTKIELVHMSFGDGTGFTGTGAEPYPFKREQSSTGPCREGPKQNRDEAFRKSARIPFPALREHSLLPTPAAILPASFFLVQTSYRQPEAPTLPDINCPAQPVFFRRSILINAGVIEDSLNINERILLRRYLQLKTTVRSPNQLALTYHSCKYISTLVETPAVSNRDGRIFTEGDSQCYPTSALGYYWR